MKSLALIMTTAVAVAALIAGCGQTAKPQPDQTQPAALPEGFFLEQAPAGAVPVSQARATGKTGDAVAFTGYIGGRAAPFTDERAVFLVADAQKTPACLDGCKTPWDACCTPAETIAANSAAVQVVDGEGRPLRLGLNGVGGLAPGSAVTVVGKIREASDAVFIVDASGVALQ